MRVEWEQAGTSDILALFIDFERIGVAKVMLDGIEKQWMVRCWCFSRKETLTVGVVLLHRDHPFKTVT